MGSPVQIELSEDEALVLFDFLARFDSGGTLVLGDQAEERALWNLHCLLEKRLIEPFQPNYPALVAAARERLRDAAR